ncbi:MAG: NAD-dependent epimerase/dehydratase family protein [Myxococcota bacterium]
MSIAIQGTGPPSAPLRRIAVFGAGGFIGSHLVAHLLDTTDIEIEAIDLTFDKLDTRSERITRITGSVRDPTIIQGPVERCDAVLSLTALCNPSLYNTRPLEVIDASYTDLVPLTDLCATRHRWLLHFSTCEVYGRLPLDSDGKRLTAMAEDVTALFLGPVPRERWTYACAKQLLERRIWALGVHDDMPFTIIRPFNVIGPRMDFVPGIDGDGIPRVLACFMHALMAGHDLPLVDGGTRRRSFVAIDDFVAGIGDILKHPDACRGEIINLGNPGNDVSIAELAAMLARTYAARVPGSRVAVLRRVSAAEFYGDGYDDSIDRIPDITKAAHLLAWEPRIPLADILPEVVDDYVGRYGEALGAVAGQR